MTEDTKDYDLIWLRNYGNLSQAEAGNNVTPKVSRVTFARWEAGKPRAPQHVYGQLAAVVGVALTDIPQGLAEAAKNEEEADKFAAEVRKLMGTPSEVHIERVVVERGLDAADLPRLPPIEYPQHLFRPSVMKKFNVPITRWMDLIKELPGEDIEVLKAAGYSWDQAVTWKDDECKARAYAILKVWETARDQHFQERALKAREERIAMPPMIYVRIVALFDKLMDEQGLDLI